MSKIIQYLHQNPQLIPMFLRGEICLIGLNDQIERQALVDVLTSNSDFDNSFWK